MLLQFVDTTELCAQFGSSMFNSNGAVPIGPNVVPLTVFTVKGFLIMLTLSESFLTIYCNLHEHLVLVSNRAVMLLKVICFHGCSRFLAFMSQKQFSIHVPVYSYPVSLSEIKYQN